MRARLHPRRSGRYLRDHLPSCIRQVRRLQHGPAEHKRLGDLLIEAEAHHAAGPRRDAIAEQRSTGDAPGRHARAHGARHRGRCSCARSSGSSGSRSSISPRSTADEQALAHGARRSVARKYVALPIEIEGRSTLTVAMADPLNVAALEDLRFHSGMFIKPVLALPSAIRRGDRALLPHRPLDERGDQHHHQHRGRASMVSTVQDDARQTPGDRRPDARRPRAARSCGSRTGCCTARSRSARATSTSSRRTSDLVVRFRVDGLLQRGAAAAQVDAERGRVAHQGALEPRHRREAPAAGRPPDGRRSAAAASTCASRRCPTTHGEKVVIRVVDQARSRSVDARRPRPATADDLATDQSATSTRPQGIVLVTGPTGSGKSTLLYSRAALHPARHQEHRDGRGPGRVPDPGHQPGAGGREGEEDASAARCARSCARTRTSS